MKILTALSLALLLGACSVGYSPRYYFHNVEVANLTGGEIRNVEAEVGERLLQCDSVAVNAICDARWGKRPYPGAGFELRWQDSSGQQFSELLSPSVPVTLSPSRSLRVLTEISPDGSVEVIFKQDGFLF